MDRARVSLFLIACLATPACSPAIDLGDAPMEEDTDTGAETTDDTLGPDEPGLPPCRVTCIRDQEEGICLDDDTCTFPDPACESGLSEGPQLDGACIPAPPLQPLDKLDVLFVVDDSGSMGNAQLRLQRGMADFVSQLEGRGTDYRIAVTTTDVGNQWCASGGVSTPELGHFVLSSCRERLAEFQFNGQGGALDVQDAACRDLCVHETLPLSEDHPWFDPAALQVDAAAASEVLECMLPQGIAGCGFESPLEALRSALASSEDPSQPEFGFVREDAHLAIIIVSDEADCSAADPDIFSSDGDKVFWSNPDDISPTSSVCWNAGVDCVDDGTGALDCNAADKSASGEAAGLETDAVLLPTSRYARVLAEARARKPLGHTVYLFGILGAPPGYDGVSPLPYRNGPNPSDPASFHARFGIGSACDEATGGAVPPVRMRELLEAEPHGGQRLFSVCDESYGATLQSIVDTIGE